MSNISEIIGNPKFQIGDCIIHRYEWEEMNDDVIRSTAYGLILGVSYCGDDNGEYIGWLYDVIVTSVKHDYPRGEFLDIYDSIAICENIPENEIHLDFSSSIDIKKVIENRQKRILNNYTNDLKKTIIRRAKY